MYYFNSAERSSFTSSDAADLTRRTTSSASSRRYYEQAMRSDEGRQKLEDDAKEFHDFIGRSLQIRESASFQELKNMFGDFCRETGRSPGPERMPFNAYLTVMVFLVGGLKGSQWSGYRFNTWPPKMTSDELLKFYLSERHSAEAIASQIPAASTGSYSGLVETLLRQSNRKVLRKTMTMAKFETALTLLPESCGNVVFGKISVSAQRSGSITIQNSSKEHSTTFVSAMLTNKSGTFKLEDDYEVTASEGISVEINPGDSYSVSLHFTPRIAMTHTTEVYFELIDSRSGGKYDLGCYVRGIATSSPVDHLVEEKYERKRKTHQRPTRRDRDYVISGQRPQRPANSLQQRPLGFYKIPQYFNKDIVRGQPTGDVKDVLEESLSLSNYQRKFKSLLWAEERQMYIDIKKYDRQETMELVEKGLLKLRVDGLAENRPSLVKGDNVVVFVQEKKEWHRGYVHFVELEDVKLKFHRKFHDEIFLPGRRFPVSFSFHQVPMRVQHQAVENYNQTPTGMLFPQSSTNSIVEDLTELRFDDRQVETNLEQAEAVRKIVSGTSRPAPYLVFGPPGTGKTKTTVEAIKQVLKANPQNNVVACTPSNSAADLICEKLLDHLPPRQVFRMNAQGRNISNVSQRVKDVSLYDNLVKSFNFPDKATLMKYRVVVATLVTAGRIVSANFPSCHFTHIFIDEAGHSTEPESLIPIAGLVTSETQQLVLAGDPKQLGPVLRSTIAIKYGLQVSLLERLMTTCSVYKRQPQPPFFNTNVVTKLVNNYRSHPAILSVPNELFYHNELKPMADAALQESLCNWEHLPKEGFPIIFDDIVGNEKTRKDSPSIYNPQEIERISHWIELLFQTRGIRVRPEDIGIISPYRKQVQETRVVIRRLKVGNMADIKIGTVEEFQGQERLVVIVSTVRSNPDRLKDDLYFKLGFVKNPKRFNVAITRAKALLIVVGNPFILSGDKHWNRFLTYVHTNGGFCGNTDFKPNPWEGPCSSDSEEDVPNTSAGNEDEGSRFALHNDPSWDESDRR